MSSKRSASYHIASLVNDYHNFHDETMLEIISKVLDELYTAGTHKVYSHDIEESYMYQLLYSTLS